MYATIRSYVTFLEEREHYAEPLTLLIKFPTRSRPEQSLATLRSYVEQADDPSTLSILVTLDQDDETVTDDYQQRLQSIHPRINIQVGHSASKIEAVNRDMEKAGDYDILLLASDDMIPIVQGYDTIIKRNMMELYPDLDGVLFFNDGHNGSRLNTLSIMGRTYYQRFNYIYHSSYKSLFCDNEFMDVAQRLGKQSYLDQVIIKHEHPVTNLLIQPDALYVKNYKFLGRDKANYRARRLEGFP